MERTLYVEGNAPSEVMRDNELTLAYLPEGLTDTSKAIVLDRVSVTCYSLSLENVYFDGSGYNEVRHDVDPAGKYAAPHWQDNSTPRNGTATDTDDRRAPVAFVSGTIPKMGVVVKFQPKPNTAKIRGQGTDDYDLPETAASIATNGTLTVPPAYLSKAFPANRVDYFRNFKQKLSVSFENMPFWLDAGETNNEVFVTWKESTWKESTGLSNYYHTMLLVSCIPAKGETINSNIVDSIWKKYQTINIYSASDLSAPLTYYGFRDNNGNDKYDNGDINYNSPDLLNVVRAYELIASGNGQCHSWAEFFVRTNQLQGIPASNAKVSIVTPNLSSPDRRVRSAAFAVKTWYKSGVAPWKIDIQYIDAGVMGEYFVLPQPDNTAIDAPGVSGQGNSPNPPSMFVNHFIARINGKYYDPSYGIGPFLSPYEYEQAAFDGLICQQFDSTGAFLRHLLVPFSSVNNVNDTPILTFTNSDF